MHSKFIITNDKGGVGKSTLAQFVILHLSRQVRPIRAVEYDRQPKLRRFFGDGVVSHSIGPEWEKQFADGASLATFWDPLVKWFQVERPLVVDFGAQVWDYFRAWGEAAMLGEIVDSRRVCLLIPVTADVEAVAAAQRVVESSVAILPHARRVVLFCDKDGEVEMLKGLPEYEAFRATLARHGVEVRRIPVLAREGYPMLAGRGWRFDKIYTAKPIDVVRATGASLMVGGRTITAVRGWVDAMTGALADVLAQPGVEVAAAGSPAVVANAS